MTDSRPGGPAVYRYVALAIAVAVVAVAIVTDGGSATRNAAAVGVIAPFALWAARPATPSLAISIPTSVGVLLVTAGGELEASMFTLSVAAMIVGGYEPSLAAFVAGGSALAVEPAVGAVIGSEADAGIWTMGVLLPLLLSRASFGQIKLARQLAATRAELADQRVLEERRRVARDVHDSVGHGLAAMLLHLTGARHVLRRDVDAADQALADAEAVGRRSMEELRRTLGLLRTESGGDPQPPVPGVADLDRRQPGSLWSRFTVIGDLRRIDALVGTSLHRVAEEAFANASRHAPDARTDATLEVRDHDVVMTIESVGTLRRADGDSGGPSYGIVGMSERMAAVGGRLHVGPTPSGWLVTATVPLATPVERDS